MRCIDVHTGFDKKDVRDFLGETLQKNMVYGGMLEYLEKQLEKIQKQIEEAKRYNAAMELVTTSGWEWKDVSDYVEDYNNGHYIGFVGTNDELKVLISSIKK